MAANGHFNGENADLEEVERAFNARNLKPILNLKDMVTNMAYEILKSERVDSKYGNRIVLELEEFMIYLPERFNSLPDTTITKMNNKLFSIINEGEIGRSYKIVLRLNGK